MASPVVTRTLVLATADPDGISLSQSPGAGAIVLNGAFVSGGVATLDVARRVIVTSGGNDTGITFTIIGTDRGGYAQSETFAGASAGAATTTRDFKTVTSATHTGSVATTITIGTSAVGSSAPIILNAFATYGTLGITAQLVSGTATFSIEITNEEYGPDWNLLATTPTWGAPAATVGVAASTLTALTASTTAVIYNPATMIRLTTTTGTGTVKLNVQQVTSEGFR